MRGELAEGGVRDRRALRVDEVAVRAERLELERVRGSPRRSPGRLARRAERLDRPARARPARDAVVHPPPPAPTDAPVRNSVEVSSSKRLASSALDASCGTSRVPGLSPAGIVSVRSPPASTKG